MSQHIDIAVNLLSSRLVADIDTIIHNAAEKNVSPLIVIGSDLSESTDAITLCQQYPMQLLSTAGVHPHQASTWNEFSKAELQSLVDSEHVVAIGECGLDYNRDFSPRDKQREAFDAQLALAVKLQMPVLMHCRDAHDDFVEIVSQYRQQLPAAVLHCFTGTRDELLACIELDLHIGITGWVCDERRGAELASIVPLIPDNRIMVETDSPYLLPRSMRPKPKSSKNLPQYLPYIVDYIAQLRGQTYEQFSDHCYRNSVNFFNLGNN
ncbi:Tat-linked quality control protein TatD [Shewanella sp. P1-14-1]|uniref:TatD family hydrolase n=1 Tax=Shewanella sp. P1-14-1 TaxID=1723761 RepID=UPI0006D66813|nr:TatD family hydrolase [Shewanella sp. P1-14-1]KPZ72312.1 Tat-linked quality control protein TatD [Shewanella sp. P1-14-1]